jgi:RHS repeat-associated protein
VRYETVRGLADTLMTPMADTIVTVVDANGLLASRTIRSTGATVQYTAWYTDALALSVDGTQLLDPNGGYTAGGFHRVVDDTSGMALSPTWAQQLGTGTSTQSLTDSTDYDGWGRLTGWQGVTDGVIQAAEGYTFDALGNVADTAGTWVYDAGTDRLTRWVDGATHRYMYDRAGNLVTDSTVGGVVWHYGYDNLERLVSARRNGVLIARYGYDVLGRRIVKRVYSSVTGGTVGYLRMVYRGSNVSFETDSAGTMGLRYTWGPGTDNLLAIQDAAGNHYYATTDRLGSVRSLAKRDGTWLLTRRWGPYGHLEAQDASGAFTWSAQLRYGWTGREYDAETGLYYLRARYYSPTQRRFLAEDPVASGLSPYAYVGGSPLEATDPSGAVSAWGGSTGAGRLWARNHLDFDCFNSPWCPRDDRDESYNLFLPVNDGWSRDYYFDNTGGVTGAVPSPLSSSRYFICEVCGDGEDWYQTFVAPSHGAQYTFHHDPADFDRTAQALAASVSKDCEAWCFKRESEEGGLLDFKTAKYQSILPLRTLWNGGNGMYFERDVVGNAAWALYGKSTGWPLDLLLWGANRQSMRVHHRPDDPQDVWGIIHGYSLPSIAVPGWPVSFW